jgi:hypothetical protein
LLLLGTVTRVGKWGRREPVLSQWWASNSQ